MDNREQSIAVVGAGIAGLTVARVLEDAGFQVSIFEAGSKIRGVGAEIGLASNAMYAFKKLGVYTEIKELGYPVEDFKICNPVGEILFEIDTHRIARTYQEESYAIHRAELYQLLLNRLNSSEIFLSKKLEDLSIKGDKVQLFFKDTSSGEFDYVIGADGIHSATRKLKVPNAVERYAGYWCWRCVAHVPKDFQFRGKALWGRKGRFGMKRMSRNRAYWFACINTPINGAIKDYKLRDLKRHFGTYKDVPELLDYSREEDVISNAIYDINPLKRFAYGRVLLMGDAAHATTPNMGQGAGMALEDVAILKEELEQNGIKKAFQNFDRRRLERTAYIIKNSRRAGRVAQMENPLLVAARNWCFRHLPSSLMQAPLKRLYDEDFSGL